MKSYSSPQLSDFGAIAGITAADATVMETDTFITASGIEIGLEGPVSQIVCVDDDDNGICDADE